MTEIFPLTKVRQFRFELSQNRAITESSFTGKRAVISLNNGKGDRWQGVLSTQVLFPIDRNPLMNFLIKVGLYGRFTMEHPDYTGPVSGAPDGAVMGDGQSGRTLVVDGFPNNVPILATGEFFQVGNEFKIAIESSSSNGSGQTTFAFEPALRVIPDNNTPVILNNPKMLAELTSPPSSYTDDLGLAEFTLSFQEAVLYE